MERWTNKVALVTGAGSGIGEAIARELCSNGVIVVGLDRLEDRLIKLSAALQSDYPSATFVSIVCDLTKEEQIKAAFNRIINDHGGVDILVNCAGLITNFAILEEGSDDDLATIFQTNVMALISCTKKAFKSMADRDTEGYIVNLCSVAGHTASIAPPGAKPFAAVYSPSKFAVVALNKMLGQELVYFNKPKIRISNVSPGVVQTDIFNAGGVSGFENVPSLKPVDVANTVIYILSTPSHVQIRDIIVEPVGSAFY